MIIHALVLGTLSALPSGASDATLGPVPARGVAQDVVRQTISKLDKRYRKAEEADERIEILNEAAELRTVGPDEPSPRVAAFLAQGLEDDFLEVRMATLPLLMSGQDPEALVDALEDGWKAASKQWEPLREYFEDPGGKRGKKKLSELGRDQLAWMLTGADYFEVFLLQLGRVPDERVEELLIEVLEEDVDDLPGGFFVAACANAGSTNSAAAMEARIACIRRLERALDDEKVERRSPPDGAPNTLLGMALSSYSEITDEMLDQMLSALRESALERQLTPAPPAERGQADAWEEWFETHRQSFDAELGKLSAPLELHVDLPEPDPAGK